MSNIIRVGDKVKHLPSGTECEITGLDITEERNSKGTSVAVPAVTLATKDDNRVTFTLSNGKWAHSWQVGIIES